MDVLAKDVFPKMMMKKKTEEKTDDDFPKTSGGIGRQAQELVS